MESDLEVVAPVASGVAIVGEDGVVEEDFQAVKIGTEAVEDDNVGRNEEEIAGERGAGFVEAVKKAPCDEEREDFGFARASGEFEDVAGPVFRKHVRRDFASGIEADEVKLVAGLADFVEPDGSFNGFTLGEVVAELRERAVGGFQIVLAFKPVFEEGARGGGRRTRICGCTPCVNFATDAGYQGREKFCVGSGTEFFGVREPALVWNELFVRRRWKLGMESHVMKSDQVLSVSR